MTLEDILYKDETGKIDLKKVDGGILIQEVNKELVDQGVKIVTERIPSKNEMEELMFSWKGCKHIKSNGIVLSRDGKTLGIGPGQVSRVWAVENAIKQSNFPTKGSVLASDAFFPFADSIKLAAEAGVTAIIQPGGSIKDQEVIDMANQYGMAMVFTSMRHFKH